MAEKPEAIKAVPVRHPWRWFFAVAIALLIAQTIWSLATVAQIDWGMIWDNLFTSQIFHAAGITLALTAVAMVMGITLGILLAVMWMSPNPIVSGVSWFYIWIFRGTPVIVQLLFWFAIAAIYPHISLGLPFGGGEFFGVESKNLITPFMAAVFGLGFNEAAYMAEIVRAGINSVDEGQEEAAAALGMGRMLTIRRIVLPQAMRVIIPPTGNETISMLKTSSLAAYISVQELLFLEGAIASRTYKPIEALIVVSIWYLFFTSILTVGQYYLERYFARGSRNAPPPSRIEYFVKNFLPKRYPREEGGPPTLGPPPYADDSHKGPHY